MSRLIDADALKENCYIKVGDTTIGRRSYVMFHEIEEAPTIDAVSVVRCKECIWFDTDNTGEDYCIYVKGLADANADDYCSYGKREGE